jgi:hypothetical protein
MKPELAFILIILTLSITIFVVIKYPSIGIPVSCAGFLLNLIINIFTKKADSN